MKFTVLIKRRFKRVLFSDESCDTVQVEGSSNKVSRILAVSKGQEGKKTGYNRGIFKFICAKSMDSPCIAITIGVLRHIAKRRPDGIY